MELSNYSINEHGVLVFNSLRTKLDSDGKRIPLTPKDFNEEYYINERNMMVINMQYEVMTVGRYGLLHGKPIADNLGLDYVRVGRCLRAFTK